MFYAPYPCPRCKGLHWHRDHLKTSATGLFTTQMVCVRCSEKLHVLSVPQQPTKCIVARRWSLYEMGRLKPQYREWDKSEPQGTPVYKPGK